MHKVQGDLQLHLHTNSVMSEISKGILPYQGELRFLLRKQLALLITKPNLVETARRQPDSYFKILHVPAFLQSPDSEFRKLSCLWPEGRSPRVGTPSGGIQETGASQNL